MAKGNGKRAYTRYGQGYDIGTSQDPSGNAYQLPPFMSYDPTFNAEIRANQRGIQDINQDYRTQKRIDRQDYRQTRKDIRQDFTRSRSDLKFGARQARRGFREKGTDVRQANQRGAQDFRLQLADTFRKYGIQASNQSQMANARGVGEGGTLAASAAKRAENQALDVGKLTLARERQKEDIATTLQRLGKDRAEFGVKYGRERKRLREDTGRSKKLAKRDFRRTRRAARRENSRANREAYFSQLDLTQSAIYNARQTNPGAFNKYGKKGKKK